MIYTTIKDFQNELFNKITFSSYPNSNFTLYTNKNNPNLGYLIKYTRENYYDLLIGDYTIPNDFTLHFSHNENLIRFGTMYSGNTEFEIENSSISSFTPSSFFISENSLKGKQNWKKGQHLHGIEIIIHKKYFDKIIYPISPETINFKTLIENYTYNYLPLEIITIIQNLKNLSEKRQLSSLYLESKILECISIISEELNLSSKNAFTTQIDYGKIKIGTDRYIALTYSDINSLQKAYEILTNSALNPPTIKALSKMVFLNEQKLKAGFLMKYHMSINKYTTSIKMGLAENLLATTELSIEEIASKVGYNHSSNFVKMFKKTHGITPLNFRKIKRY